MHCYNDRHSLAAAIDENYVNAYVISGGIIGVAESMMRCCREAVNSNPCNRMVASALLQMALPSALHRCAGMLI